MKIKSFENTAAAVADTATFDCIVLYASKTKMTLFRKTGSMHKS